jgi:hypothetical protein
VEGTWGQRRPTTQGDACDCDDCDEGVCDMTQHFKVNAGQRFGTTHTTTSAVVND